MGLPCDIISFTPASTLYELYVSSFVRKRVLKNGAQPDALAPDLLLLRYYKRVPLLARIQWALGVIHSL